jgi:plastocyanin
MTSKLRWTICAAAALALAAPNAAQAAKKTVFMGIPPAAGKAFEKTGSDVNAFFPSSVAVHAGDTVSFAPVGFHSVDLPAPGGTPLGLVSPTGKKVSAGDEAGIPFWFDTAPELGFDKGLLQASFGKTFVKGATRIASGLPLGEKLKPMNVRFPKAGTYTYFCNIHPGMKGSVRDVGKRSPVPSAKADALRVKLQTAAALAVAKRLPTVTKPPANTISVGAGGAGGVELFAFVPDKLTVPAGTTVSFAMSAKSRDVHTATTGPGPADKPATYLGKLAASFDGAVLDGRAAYPSELPGTPPAALSPALHGNGFWSSGIMDAAAASPLPASGSVTLSTPGTYRFVCLIHPFMKETITVR